MHIIENNVISKLNDLEIIEVLSNTKEFKLTDRIKRSNAVIRVRERDNNNNLAIVSATNQEINPVTLNIIKKTASEEGINYLGVYKCSPKLLIQINNIDRRSELTDKYSDTEKLIGSLINKGLEIKASDIHIQLISASETTDILFRVNGLIQFYKSYSLKMGERILNALYQRQKGAANQGSTLNYENSTSFKIEWDDDKRKSVRVECSPNALYFKSVWRLLAPNDEDNMTYENLGYDKQTCEMFERFTYLSSGAVIFTGPVGSGKSTSMYTHLSKIIANHTDNKGNITKIISSIEDPVEQILFGADQRQVNSNVDDKEKALNNVLGSLLRSDPDLVFLGEMRYLAQAKVMLDIGEIGNFAYGTMHADTHVGAIRRLYEKFGFNSDFFSINGSLTAIVAQKLTPVICNSCGVNMGDLIEENNLPAYFTTSVLEIINKSVDYYLTKYISNLENLKIANKNSGCTKCSGSGFSHRTLVYEIYCPSKALSNVVDLYEKKKFGEGYEAFMKAEPKNGIDGITLGERCLDKIIDGSMCAFEGSKLIASYPISERRLKVNKVDKNEV